MAELVETTHGGVDPVPERLFDTRGVTTRKTTPIWHYPLYGVVFALAIDVFLRRVRLWKAGMLAWGQRP